MVATSALQTVGQILTEARVLLQDRFEPYRYSDNELVEALNIGMLEARRLRADLFIPSSFAVGWINTDDTVDLDATVAMDPMYRPGLVYYVVGRAQLRDDEATTDQRAQTLMQKFLGQLLVITS